MKRSTKSRVRKRVGKSVKKMGKDFKKSPLAKAARGEKVRL